MTIKRTPEEIVERIISSEQGILGGFDFMGWERSDLIQHLAFEHAKPFLKDDVTEEMWLKDGGGLGDPVKEALAYLPFAWEKANDCRGLSANRSLCHLRAWLWLAGVDVDELIPDYELYGKPQLVMISEAVGFNWRRQDNAVWTNDATEPGLSGSERWLKIDEAAEKAKILKEQLSEDSVQFSEQDGRRDCCDKPSLVDRVDVTYCQNCGATAQN